METQEKAELLQKIQELEEELKRTKKQKKYGLVWEEKPEEFEKQAKNAFPVLEEKENGKWDIKTTKNSPTNILIEGDNFHSLSVLSYTHREKIDVIYIDPPYNTGNKDFIYNDKIIDKEDNFRHSKWLSFMAKRLRIAKNLLKNSGVIFISIDDNEVAQLKLLCDDIFGNQNFISKFIWRSSTAGGIRSKFVNSCHEYCLCYAKNIFSLEMFFAPLSEKAIQQYNKEDEKGIYREKDFAWKNSSKGENQKYFIKCPDGEMVKPQEGYLFRFIEETFEKNLKEGNIVFKNTKTSPLVNQKGEKAKWNIYVKKYLGEGTGAPSSLIPENIGLSNLGTSLIQEIFGERVFQNPKSPQYIKYLLSLKENKSATILDFFAGSGTTGHAVLELNKEDGGNRQFILCTNNESNICEEVTYERLKRVMQGYTNNKGDKVEGLGGSLKYLKTDFVEKEDSIRETDEDKLKLTQKVGCMLALKENTFSEIEKNEYHQTFENDYQVTGIYFREDKTKLDDYVEALTQTEKKVKLYIFSWMKGEYKNAFLEYPNLTCEDIPEPILEVYKSIGL